MPKTSDLRDSIIKSGVSRRKILSTIALGSTALGAAVLEIKSGSGSRLLSIPSRLLESEVAGSANAQEADPTTTIISTPSGSLAGTFFIPLDDAAVGALSGVGYTLNYNRDGKYTSSTLQFGEDFGEDAATDRTLTLEGAGGHRVGDVSYTDGDATLNPYLQRNSEEELNRYTIARNPLPSTPVYIAPKQILSAEGATVLTYFPVSTQVGSNFYFAGFMLGTRAGGTFVWDFQSLFGAALGAELFYVKENAGADPSYVTVAQVNRQSSSGRSITGGTQTLSGSTVDVDTLPGDRFAIAGVPSAFSDIVTEVNGFTEIGTMPAVFTSVIRPGEFPTTPLPAEVTTPFPTTTPDPTTGDPRFAITTSTVATSTTDGNMTTSVVAGETTVEGETTTAAMVSTTIDGGVAAPTLPGELSVRGAVNSQGNIGRDVSRTLSGRLSSFRKSNRMRNRRAQVPPRR